MVIDPLTAVLNWAEPENSGAKREKRTVINDIISTINEIITQLGAQNELGELTDVTISGTPADNELLAYDNGSSEWINQTAGEAGLSTTGHGHTASDVSDFDTEVGNHTDVALNTTHRGTTTGNPHNIDYSDAGAEQAFSKNTAFNKNFGGSGSATTPSRSDHDHSYDADLMIGSANAEFVPTCYDHRGQVSHTASVYAVLLTGTKYYIATVPLPTNRGGLKLYCGDLKINVQQADANNYLDTYEIVGVNGAGVATVLGTPYTTPDITTAGEKILTYTAQDCSGYDVIFIRLIFSMATTTLFKFGQPQIESYYA